MIGTKLGRLNSFLNTRVPSIRQFFLQKKDLTVIGCFYSNPSSNETERKDGNILMQRENRFGSY